MNQREQIVSVFQEMGGATTFRLAQECIDRGMFEQEALRRASLRWVQGICREALKQVDPTTGLPFAGPTSQKAETEDGKEGGRLWQQMTFMNYEDFAFNITERSAGLWADYSILARMRDYCLERFGKAPRVPVLYGRPETEAI